ncbi:MAG: TylF/MycF/NovP-related O-methyltransferase, partial [Candidatus Saccharibacteria bacterium]|nr:TylF/MycF/NovP-related O-methyltransferase [Candidatus Saccharibacteria bacterium]
LTLQKEGDLDRYMYLYDTYAGMVEPTAIDVHVGNKETALETWKKEDQGDYNDWCYASLEEVKANIVSTGYAAERLIFVVGKVEETIPKTIPGSIALLRLDTDWYESTYHELMNLYPLIVKNGVLIVDDYGAWEGSRKAVDQYIEENHLKMLLTKIGRSGRMAVKSE